MHCSDPPVWRRRRRDAEAAEAEAAAAAEVEEAAEMVVEVATWEGIAEYFRVNLNHFLNCCHTYISSSPLTMDSDSDSSDEDMMAALCGISSTAFDASKKADAARSARAGRCAVTALEDQLLTNDDAPLEGTIAALQGAMVEDPALFDDACTMLQLESARLAAAVSSSRFVDVLVGEAGGPGAALLAAIPGGGEEQKEGADCIADVEVALRSRIQVCGGVCVYRGRREWWCGCLWRQRRVYGAG